jgi:hypothetical protein
MTLVEQAIYFSGLLIAITLVVVAGVAYSISRRRMHPDETPELRVERAYRAARRRAKPQAQPTHR